MDRDFTSREPVERHCQELLRRLVDNQEEQRLRISRELHDQVGQRIVALTLEFKKLEDRLAGDPALKSRLEELYGLVADLDRAVHRAACDLRPASLDDLGLRAALENMIDQWQELYPARLDFQVNNLQESNVNPETSLAIYRVVQEALLNIARHSAGTHIRLALDQQPHMIEVTVEDNGRGFVVGEVDHSPQEDRRLGILGMKERVELAGGSFRIESTRGKGTAIYARFPIDE